ncbi:MAG: GAF domain-containing protein [Spirochaetes bacterium]|nr:GAF domain-containing protein [Spirochaetota bacterium]
MSLDKKQALHKKQTNKDITIPYRRTSKKIKKKVNEDEKTMQKIFRSFFELGQLIGLDLNLEEMIIQIAKKATEVMEAERYNLFLHDRKTDDLWTIVAAGVEGKKIRIPAGEGVSGYCFRTGETVNLKDAYSDPRFFRQADLETDYRTKTLLSMPCYSRSGKILGVIQLTNKKNGIFTKEDETFLKMFSNHAAVFIEMAQLQRARFNALEKSREEVEQLSRAKDKALYHLSHELRTPLSVIHGIVKILKRKLGENDLFTKFDNSFVMLEKHLKRLSVIQQETDKIIRTYQEVDKGLILSEMDRQWRQLEDTAEIPIEIKLHWDMVKKWISANVHGSRITEVQVSAVPFIDKILEKIKRYSSHRELTFETEYRGKLSMLIIPGVQQTVLEGLLKNAVENTPDGGLIRVILEEDQDKILLKVHDFGIGIIQENQRHIFDGFFYTQETDIYSSKKPYDFGAGGKGLDLMLGRIYGQRFGFQITFESRRCKYIPADKDMCPGKISLCEFCKSNEDCLASGGSTFIVSLPINKKVL